jgi:TP901 family phage tail tape measure protein
MQRLTDALGRRAAEQERMAADAAAERVETRVRRQQSKLQENAYVRAEAARRQRVQQMYEAGAGQYPQGAGPETGAAYAQQQRELEAWQQMRARMFREGGVYPGNQLIPQRGMPTWMRLAQATREVAAAPGGQLIPQAQLPSFIGRPRALNVPQQTPTAADATRAARATDLQGRAAGRAAGAHSQNAQAITAEAEAIAQAQGTYDRWAASSRGLASELDRTSIAADLSSQRFRKHGALTTEFIEAAAKGEVTLRELGYQLTATIGKFAGWTGAATLVYGAVGAFSELSKGAIAAESSVGLVSRVVTRDFSTGALKQDLRGLSAEFNVSMQDAADAVYGAGKTFHDLPGAVEGARTALFAMKVGELDAATATDSLASIVRGFQLQASDLPGVLDTINQATNRYGGNVGNLVQGVARAAGQFKLAGGSYRELVAILTAGSRLTGASAQEVGTAVGRMVSTVHTAAGATRARAAGLDPTLDPLALVQQAQRLARGASPERVQELARAIIPTGGQYARIFVPLIQNARLLNSVLDDTTPEKSKGSAQRELAKVLSQANEQLKKVANSLQQLGAALAQAGLLTPFLALIRVTNLAITGVTKLLELFDRVVPDPFQKPLGTLLELYGVLRLLRRFDVGGQIAAGGRLEGLRQYVSAGPQRQTQRQIFQGISAQQRFLGDTRERVGQQAALVTFREQQAGRRFQQAEAAGDAALMERRAAQLQRVSEQAADLVDEEADLRRLINETDQRRIDTLRGIRQGMTAEQAFLAAGGTYRTAGFDRPTTQGPEQVGEPAPRREPFVPIAAGTTGRPRDVTRYIDEVEALAAAEGETAVRARGIQQGLGKLGTAGSALGGAAAGGVRAAQAARAGMGAAGAGIGRLALALGAALGPLDYALLGLVAVYEVIGLAQKASAQHAEQIRRAQQSTASPEQIRRNVADLPTQEDIRRQTVSARGPIAVTTQARRDAALRARQEARARDLARQQDVGRLLDLPTIQQRYRTQQSTAGSRRQQFSAIQQALGELGQSYYAVYGQRDLAAAQRRGDKGEVARVQSAIKAVDDYRDYLNSAQNALASLGGEISQALAAAKTFDQLNAFIDEQTANFELAGGRGRAGHAAGRALGRAAVRAAQLFGQTNDPVAYLKTLKGIADTTTTQAENQLKRLLDAAKTPAQRRQAYRTAYRGLRVQLGIPEQQAQLEQVRGQQGERQRQINELQSRQRLARLVQQPAADPLTGTTLGGLPAGLTERQQARLRKLVQAYAQGTREERALAKGIRYMQQAFRDIKQQDDQANAEALFAAQTAVGAANQPAGAARIRFLIVRAGIAVRNAIRAHGRSSVEALQAINEQQQLMAQAVQEQASIIQANAALAEANATTPHGEFLANVGGLNNLLALQRANPKVYSPADNTQLQAQIQGATKSENQRLAEDAKQKREEAEQKAKDLIEARYGYLESLTDDPLKIARLEEQKATALLAHAKDPAERYQALAARNQARRDRQNAYYQRRQDELDLQHDVGRLSDQAYLRGLERLWHRMQRGSQAWRDMRAKILRFKHDMENAADDMPELNVGNIRLPTVYDVRRIIRQGTQTNVVQHNVVNVDARGQDPQAVVAHLHRHFGSQTKAGMRAAGVRG